jgi:hypothetical protein
VVQTALRQGAQAVLRKAAQKERYPVPEQGLEQYPVQLLEGQQEVIPDLASGKLQEANPVYQ